MYSIGGSPSVYNSFNASQTPGKLNYVPYPREQGACNSCVGQAVAAAIQMSIAYTLRESVYKFNVSAGALYYCVAGGRTCKTGRAGVVLVQMGTAVVETHALDWHVASVAMHALDWLGRHLQN
jgi:hypothetical protein